MIHLVGAPLELLSFSTPEKALWIELAVGNNQLAIKYITLTLHHCTRHQLFYSVFLKICDALAWAVGITRISLMFT